MNRTIYEQRQSAQGGLVAVKEDPSELMNRITERTATKVIDYAGSPEFAKNFSKNPRNFPGSTTSRKKGAYGPAMNYSATSDKMGDGGFTNSIPGVGGVGSAAGAAGAGAGASAQLASVNTKAIGIVESKAEKFITFVESLRTNDNEYFLGLILEGFVAITESEKWMQKSQKSGEVKKGKMHSLLGISQDKDVSDVYKSGAGLYNALAKKVGDASAMKMINYAANTAGNQLYVSARAYGKKKNDKN